ncbi:hypothetical protein F4780DRAFT_158547 [Xylariomycetidae sp. FL0641]|nr:hypothetical protein F4780DRAFT_158547 [Xylariomycetidae sp. FL0641]
MLVTTMLSGTALTSALFAKGDLLGLQDLRWSRCSYSFGCSTSFMLGTILRSVYGGRDIILPYITLGTSPYLLYVIALVAYLRSRCHTVTVTLLGTTKPQLRCRICYLLSTGPNCPCPGGAPPGRVMAGWDLAGLLL